LPLQGDVIASKYRVERLIGMGGMGVVVAARHIELDERVAIKMLLPHLPATGEPAARFLREAKAAIRIKNEHVVRVLDVGRTDTGSPYIVMEYLDGQDLGQLLERSGPLPVEDTVDYVMQACEAIAAAHALGIVHRDLKPANLFLAAASDGTAFVKVLDFGISKIAETASSQQPGLTSTATVMGTPCFMSPEQLRSTRDVDARADIWSMGAILHALMTGTPPYDGESNADVSAKIIRDAPTPLRVLRAEVPADLEAIVLRCLEKDPARRFADVASLAEALSRVTPRDSSKASAVRVARIAAAVAPTVLSEPPHHAQPFMPGGQATPGPTRTASAWGDTRREEKRGRRIAGMVGAAGIVAGAIVFGVLRWHTDPAASVSPVQATASAPATQVPAATTAPETQAAAPASSASTAPTAALSAAVPAGKPGASHAGAGKGVATGPAPGTTAAPTATTKPKGGAGLFDGRE
jgi:serine/threonine-protein kinase